MLFLLLLELTSNDDSSTIKIFHCLHFLILVGVFLITFSETLQFGLYKHSPAADRPTHSIQLVPRNCSLPSRTFRCCSKASWREDCKYTTPRNNNNPICIQACGHCWHQKVYNPHVSNQLNCWKYLKHLVPQQNSRTMGQVPLLPFEPLPLLELHPCRSLKWSTVPRVSVELWLRIYLRFSSALKQLDIKYTYDFN